MTSLKSRGYVKEQFNWQWYYWFITDEGIEYLRKYLNIPAEVLPKTYKQPKVPDRPAGGGFGGRGGGRGFGGGGRGGRRFWWPRSRRRRLWSPWRRSCSRRIPRRRWWLRWWSRTVWRWPWWWLRWWSRTVW